MTYCVGISLDAGIVALADSRTNAGVDNISTFAKLSTWSAPAIGQTPARALGLMSSGNLSITQEVVAILEEEIAENGPNQDGGLITLLSAASMFRAAERVGNVMAEVQTRRGPQLAAAGVSSGASLLLAGQIGPTPPELYMIYQAGNFIEATPDTPFMQIGEFKYGKPILDRMVRPEISLEDGAKAAALSMAATLRSNLSVGMPLDLAVLPTDAFAWRTRRIEADDEGFQQIAQAWNEHLRQGFFAIQPLPLSL